MDLKNQRELAKLVNFLRKSGVTSFKSGDFEITLATTALFPESAYKQRKKAMSSSGPDMEIEDQLTEEQALYWSSEGIPEEKATH